MKLNRHLPCNLSTIPLKRYLIYPREIKTYGHIKTCTQIFREVLFVIGKTQKQSRCSSTHEWINKMWNNVVLSNKKGVKYFYT